MTDTTGEGPLSPQPGADGPVPVLPDLRPARWIWYLMQRCLANTFVLFRREVELPSAPVRATGWITADSRYLLRVNGRRVQWGPPPCDPRYLEVDPVDLTGHLRAGRNVLGVQALYFGHGDGTWPAGKPGVLVWIGIELAGGQREVIVSDERWQACLPRAWRRGQYKRSYVRALQEEFDARRYPEGWDTPAFVADDDWQPAMMLDLPADEPPICSPMEEYVFGHLGDPRQCELRARSIPLLREVDVRGARLTEAFYLRWKRPAEEYFDFVVPGAFEKEDEPPVGSAGDDVWEVALDGRRGAALTFEFSEQVVGWPCFTIDAPAGTVVEMLVHEAHAPDGPPLLNTHFHSWTRFICREGRNRFETFDYESLRWLQLHIRGPAGEEHTARIGEIGVRRRLFPWPHDSQVTCGEPALQRLMDASVNTLHNCAQDQCVDGMARERQQYSGDCGHQLHGIYLAFGETRLPRRFITTYSQGLTVDGYFLDCWPAYDRLARVMSRQIGLSSWGPILDHGVGFNFDCFHHYLYTGDLNALEEPFPRLRRFFRYLEGIRGDDGLLPVEGLGVPIVWIDHQGYRAQRHKQCAFNLYTAAMLEHAHAPLCRAFGEDAAAEGATAFGRSLLDAAVRRFWSDEHGAFVNNLPWVGEEGGIRYCDRSLATAVLFEQCPAGRIKGAARVLADTPAEMGWSYPANAGWRLWALGKLGRTDVVLRDLRQRWATMDSVRLNNTLQEDWEAVPDSGQQWSHCAVAPLYIMFMTIAGIRPTAPGFARCEIRPQPADLEQLDLTARTVRGPIRFTSSGRRGDRTVRVALPAGCEGELVVAGEERIDLEPAGPVPSAGLRRYRLPAGHDASLRLEFT